MKKIGMIVAVEMDAVLQLYGAPKGKEKRGGFTVYTYENTDYALYVLNSGAGELGAAAATQNSREAYGTKKERAPRGSTSRGP